jgi:hypothetical protein
MSSFSPECASSADVWPVLTALEFGRALPIKLRQIDRIDAATVGPAQMPRLQAGPSECGLHPPPAQGGGDEN